MTQEELNEVLEKHQKWLNGEPGGERAVLVDADLSDLELAGANLQRANLSGVNLSGTWLPGADLTEADLSGAVMTEANLEGVRFRRAKLRDSDLTGSDLRGAWLQEADLTDTNLSETSLTQANLTSTVLIRADLHSATFREAVLEGADLTQADLHKANLLGANMQNAVLSRASLRRANLHNADLSHAHLQDAALNGAKLEGADFRDADLSRADLYGVDLSMGILAGAKLQYAFLSDAYLPEADLTGVDFTGADLRYADLRDANLFGAILTGANLRGTDLTDAKLPQIEAVAEVHAQDFPPATMPEKNTIQEGENVMPNETKSNAPAPATEQRPTPPKKVTFQNKAREQLAQKFLAALEQGRIPWQACWQQDTQENATTKQKYHGINSVVLSLAAADAGFSDPRWCTFKQAQAKGWKIQKGATGCHIEYWAYYDSHQKKLLPWKEALELLKDETYAEMYLRLSTRTYVVFNAEQINGIPEREQHQQTDIGALREQRDTLLKNMNLQYQERGNRAYYTPGNDTVTLPPEKTFFDTYSYMGTFLHECGHATGHESRLNRDLSGKFRTAAYAKEELRAEIASAFTAQALGLHLSEEQLQSHTEQHMAYIQSWAAELRDAPKELFAAIQDAEKISDYLIEKGEFQQTMAMEQSQQQEQPKDRYQIWQLKNIPETRYDRFMDYAWLTNQGRQPEARNYNLVYEGDLTPDMTLDKLYDKFNVDRPADFTGYSLSISDIITLKHGNQAEHYYVDRTGFQPLPDFGKAQEREVPLQEQTAQEARDKPKKMTRAEVMEFMFGDAQRELASSPEQAPQQSNEHTH